MTNSIQIKFIFPQATLGQALWQFISSWSTHHAPALGTQGTFHTRYLAMSHMSAKNCLYICYTLHVPPLLTTSILRTKFILCVFPYCIVQTSLSFVATAARTGNQHLRILFNSIFLARVCLVDLAFFLVFVLYLSPTPTTVIVRICARTVFAAMFRQFG